MEKPSFLILPFHEVMMLIPDIEIYSSRDHMILDYDFHKTDTAAGSWTDTAAGSCSERVIAEKYFVVEVVVEVVVVVMVTTFA